MKKRMILLATAVFTMMLFAGCSKEAAPFTEKSYDVDAAQVKEVNIDVRDREITVSLSADAQIHIVYAENEQEYYEIAVSDDQVLSMKAATDKEWSDYVGSNAAATDRKIELQVPNEMLANLTLATTNEDIVLPTLSVEDSMTISVNGGDITFEKVQVGNALELTGKNGDIKGSVVGSYDDFAISTEIKKGENNLPAKKESGTKQLNVTNNNGDIEIEIVNE